MTSAAFSIKLVFEYDKCGFGGKEKYAEYTMQTMGFGTPFLTTKQTNKILITYVNLSLLKDQYKNSSSQCYIRI